MTSDADPWKGMKPPDRADAFNARRVGDTGQLLLAWAVDMDNRCLLVLQHGAESGPHNRLPKLRGLDFRATRSVDGETGSLLLALEEREQREIFHRLCLDIVETVRGVATETEAVQTFIMRTWRWHRLLTGGRDGRLSPDEQKGLLGEMEVLKFILRHLSALDAIESWMGPLGAPKDFEIGRLAIEAKARRSGAVPHVRVSSEHQLDERGLDELFLAVIEIAKGDPSDGGARTLTEALSAVRNLLDPSDTGALDAFEHRLAAVGFDWSHDYTDSRWSIGRSHHFQVRDDFPRSTPAMFPVGASGVRYAVELPAAEPWRVDLEAIAKRLGGHGG